MLSLHVATARTFELTSTSLRALPELPKPFEERRVGSPISCHQSWALPRCAPQLFVYSATCISAVQEDGTDPNQTLIRSKLADKLKKVLKSAYKGSELPWGVDGQLDKQTVDDYLCSASLGLFDVV